jgi:hypothetical protein
MTTYDDSRAPLHGEESEFVAWCVERLARIFVREQLGGVWGSHSLAEISPERREYWIHRWWEEGRQPIVLREQTS